MTMKKFSEKMYEKYGMYIRQNRRDYLFEIVQSEDGYVYDGRFPTEQRCQSYLDTIITNIHINK